MPKHAMMTAFALCLGLVGQVQAATFLVGNTTGNDIVIVDTVRQSIRTFVSANSGGLVSPDDMTIGPDGNLYVSSATSNTDGAILRFDGQTGAFIDVFATSSSLRRPYGHAFGPDGLLYVSSFRSDEILRYDATTGAFFDVFAAGNGTPDGLNGPNDLHFGPDGKLYVTTQGSVAQPDGSISFSQESQILRYDIATGAGAVFAAQPAPDPVSFGFVSFLGIVTGPDGNLWTSDFANGLRVYDVLSGSLVDQFGTNYTGTVPSGNFVGSLAFMGDTLVVPGFTTGGANLGTLMVFDPFGGGSGFTTLFADDPRLLRPIGILAVNLAPVPLPASGLLLLGVIGGLALRRQM